jgi:hypothetical protein
LGKRLRKRQADLLAAVEAGNSEAVLAAARAWAEVENEAARDVSEKTASPPTHRVSFLVEEGQYVDFCEKATEQVDLHILRGGLRVVLMVERVEEATATGSTGYGESEKGKLTRMRRYITASGAK